MSDDRRFERAARDWLELGPAEAPDRTVQAALVQIDSTIQERDLRIPWRLSPMSTTARIALAAALVIAVGAGAFLAFRGSPGAVGGPGPGATASPSPTASADANAAISAYVAARDAVCTTYAAQLSPLRLRFVGVFDATLTTAQWTDWLAALQQFVAGYDGMLAALNALTPPPSLVAGHAANLQQIRDMSSLVSSVITELQAGAPDAQHTNLSHLQRAAGIDASTDPIARANEQWENSLALVHCP